MHRRFPAAVAALLLSLSAVAEQGGPRAGIILPDVAADYRHLVEMPPEARTLLRGEMLGHLSALDAVLSHLGNGEFPEAAAAARGQLGTASMGRHRTANAAPGRFMPAEMRAIAMEMHAAADRLAVAAEAKDLAKSLQALREVTGQCLICHYSFRVR
jgi:hypothetical protein